MISLFSCLAVTQAIEAETVKVRIEAVSRMAGTVQIGVGKDKAVVRIDQATRLEGFSSIDELNPPDLIESEREPGQPAARIRKIVFGLPPCIEIDTAELLQIMTGQAPYHLFDARPVATFGKAHVPSAGPAHPKDGNFLDLLPADKAALLVFYCGGSTCPYTGIAIDMAGKVGYSSLRDYQAGLPGWIKSKLPVHTEAGWLEKNLDPQTVVLDARSTAASSRSHMEGAVAMSVRRMPWGWVWALAPTR